MFVLFFTCCLQRELVESFGNICHTNLFFLLKKKMLGKVEVVVFSFGGGQEEDKGRVVFVFFLLVCFFFGGGSQVCYFGCSCFRRGRGNRRLEDAKDPECTMVHYIKQITLKNWRSSEHFFSF